MDEYFLYYKRRLPRGGNWNQRWDVFLSAYNSSDRVRVISQYADAEKRYWLILPEYHYAANEFPSDAETLTSSAENEAQVVREFLRQIPDLRGKRIAIDITGLIVQYVLVLLDQLQTNGIAACDVIYGEPIRYLHSERTRFSDESVMEVRQVAGYEGVHTTDTGNDLLVVAVGYDFRLVAEVTNSKEHAKKVQLFGLPSLRPDMYQEGLLQAYRVSEAMGPDASHPQHFQYAPAHDPFITASVLSNVVREHRLQNPRANIYLSPLSTKAQALGFAVYYLRECPNTATSIIYPFCRSYMKETSEGLSGAWLYHIELANLDPKLGRGVA